MLSRSSAAQTRILRATGSTLSRPRGHAIACGIGWLISNGRNQSRSAASCLKRIAGEYGYGRTDDLLAAMGYGKIVPRNVIAKYLGAEKFEALDKQKESRLRTGVRAVKRLITGDDAIVVRGVEDLMVNRARCCNPLHGEQIIGYITRGKGVAVHTARCKNVKQL